MADDTKSVLVLIVIYYILPTTSCQKLESDHSGLPPVVGHDNATAIVLLAFYPFLQISRAPVLALTIEWVGCVVVVVVTKTIARSLHYQNENVSLNNNSDPFISLATLVIAVISGTLHVQEILVLIHKIELWKQFWH
jgi:hypothetical protein